MIYDIRMYAYLTIYVYICVPYVNTYKKENLFSNNKECQTSKVKERVKLLEKKTTFKMQIKKGTLYLLFINTLLLYVRTYAYIKA